MDENTMYIIIKIETLISTSLVGSLVETLNEQLIKDKDGLITLNAIALKQIETLRHTNHHKFVTQNRSFAAVNREIVCFLQDFLKQRFSIEKNHRVINRTKGKQQDYFNGNR